MDVWVGYIVMSMLRGGDIEERHSVKNRSLFRHPNRGHAIYRPCLTLTVQQAKQQNTARPFGLIFKLEFSTTGRRVKNAERFVCGKTQTRLFQSHHLLRGVHHPLVLKKYVRKLDPESVDVSSCVLNGAQPPKNELTGRSMRSIGAVLFFYACDDRHGIRAFPEAPLFSGTLYLTQKLYFPEKCTGIYTTVGLARSRIHCPSTYCKYI